MRIREADDGFEVPYEKHRSEDIPDWQDRFRRILKERRFLAAIKALDNLLADEKFIQKPSPSQTQRVIRMLWAPYYSSTL